MPRARARARTHTHTHTQANLEGIHVLVLAFSRDVDLGAVLNRKLAADLKTVCFKY